MAIEDLTYITVTGQFNRSDGSASSGAVRFAPTGRWVNQSNEQIVTPEPIVGELVDGGFTCLVPATDDVGFLPATRTMLVSESIDGASRRYTVQLPHTAGTVDLSSLAPIDPVDDRAVYQLSGGASFEDRLERLEKGAWVYADADPDGIIPANTAIAAAIALLPFGRGNVQLPRGTVLFDPGISTGGAVVWGNGHSGNPAVNGGTRCLKNGDGTGWIVGNYGGLMHVDFDGDNTAGVLVHWNGERTIEGWVSYRNAETNFRHGAMGGGNNTSEHVGHGVYSYASTGTAPYTGGAVFHDDTTPSPTAPNCDSGVITGFESKGHAGNGATVGAARGWTFLQSRVSLNGAYGWEILAAGHGVTLVKPYVEANATKDIMVRQGATDYDIGPARWGTATGNNWVDENVTLGTGALGRMVRRPSKTNRPTSEFFDVDKLNVSIEGISGWWQFRQALADRALEMAIRTTGTTPIAVRWMHDSAGKLRGNFDGDFTITSYLKLLDFTTGPGLFAGAGSPEGVVGARIGSIYMQTDGGIWTKKTGTGSTGWVNNEDNPQVFPAANMQLINGVPSNGTVGGIHSCKLLDSATTETMAWSAHIPSSWNTFDIQCLWTNAGAGSGDVVLDVIRRATVPGAALAAGSAQTTTTFTAPAQNVLQVSTLAAGCPVAAADNLQNFRVGRIGGDAADTLPNDIGVIEMRLVRAS